MKYRLKRVIANVMAISLVLVALGYQAGVAQATQVTTFSDNMSRLSQNTLSDHDIRFVTPTGVDASTDTIILTFSANFTMGSFAVTNVDLNVSASSSCSSFGTSKTLAASPSSGVWGVAQSGQAITLTAPTGATTGEITAGRCVQVLIGSAASTGGAGTTQITNPTSAGTDTLAITGTFGDTGTADLAVIASDQVAITATVNPNINFSISQTAIDFGVLGSGAAKYATGGAASGGNASSATVAHTLIAGTNATSGYVMYVKGATLTSGANTITAIGGSATASSAGSEQFGLNLANTAPSGGSGTATAPYSTSSQYAYNATASTQVQIASATGSTADTTYSATYIANIASNTEAGSYSTSLTYTATASF